MPRGHSWFGAALGLDGRIYAFGGEEHPAGVDAYDPATDTWTMRADLPTPRVALCTAATDAGLVYAIGGSPSVPGDYFDVVESYGPALDTWYR
jgi:hypothetical protein